MNGNLVWDPEDSFLDFELASTMAVSSTGRLSGDATFSLSIYGDTPVSISIPVVDNRTVDPSELRGTGDNESLDDLVDDIAFWLDAAGLGDQLVVEKSFDLQDDGPS